VIGRYLLHISVGMLMGKMQQNMKVLLSSRVKLNKWHGCLTTKETMKFA